LHSAGQDSLLLLWCYGIIILAGVPEALLCQSDQSTNFAKQWKTTSARRLFETPKGLKKSIDLNFISVIWVMKEEVGVSDEDAIEGIKIATRAMRLVDESTKAKWLKSTDIARQSVAKLADKILRSGMNPCVRFAGLCFYATMTGGNDLPEELVTEYESLLLRLKELESDPEALRETLESSLPLYAPRVQESTIRQLLVKILESSTSSKHSSELRNTGILVGVLMNAATGSLSRLLPSALCSNEMQEHLHLFLSATIESSEPVETCDSSLNLSRRDLYTNTISMLLTSLLAAGTTHYQSAPAIGVALINKQRKLAPFHKPCSHLKPSSPPTISFFEQGCTPASGIHRQDWRDSLGSELERQSYYQRDSVIRSVAQICQNLEDRCNSVEGPLRQEQAKVKELTLVVSQLRKQVADMETDAIDRQCISNGLEAEIENANKENDDLAAKLEELEAETENANRGKDDLTAKLAELRATFDRANKEADESLLKAQEDLRTQEVVFRSTISAQEESLRSRDRQIGELDAQKEGLEDQLRALESEKVSLGELYSTLKAELDAAYQNLQIELENTTRQAGEIGQLNARQSDLEDRLANTKEKLEDTLDEQKEMAQKIDQLNDTRSSLENQLTSAKQQLEDTLNERSELQVRVKESEQALRDMEIKHANQLDAVTLKVVL
jgi:predicted  nucleic acid-binding Zn-ribbon protein